jgi:hypothetical protein
MTNRGEHAIAAETLANRVAVTSDHARDRWASAQDADVQCQKRRRVRGKGASPSGRFLIQALFPDATIPSPHADGQNRRKG